MGAEMEDRIGGEIFAKVTIESAERMCRGECPFEQHPHGVAFIAKGRLDADEDFAELYAVDVDRAAIRLRFARCWPPLRFDFVQEGFATDMIVGRDTGVDISIRAEALGVSFQKRIAQGVNALGQVNVIPFGFQATERGEHRSENREIRSSARRTGVGWKVEEDNGEFAIGAFRTAQCDQLGDFGGQCFGALGAGTHFADQATRRENAAARATGAGLARAIRPAAEHIGDDRPIEFRDSDHHRRFEREQAHSPRAPLLKRLELKRVGRDIRAIEPREHILRSFRIVVSRTTDERKARQRDNCIDGRDPVFHEIGFDGGARVEATGKCGNDIQAACL